MQLDAATLAGADSLHAHGHSLGVPSHVPAFECSKAWSDTTSISFTIIMILGTISDRLLKGKTPGKQSEGLAGILSWIWETYDQGYGAIYEYIFNYIGEYAAYWIIIVGVSSGLSFCPPFLLRKRERCRNSRGRQRKIEESGSDSCL